MLAAPLVRPIHLALSYDEEVGCVGVRSMIARLEHAQVKPTACFVGEPTEMGVVIGHKGQRAFRVSVHGKSCHSSLAPQGVNAVEYAARLIVKIREIGDRVARSGARDPLYDVPYTTANTGVVHGGTVFNIVPDLCTFEFEFRPIAADDVDGLVEQVMDYAREQLEPQMRAVDPAAYISFEPKSNWPRPRGSARFRCRRAREDARRPQRAQQGRLWYRGGTVCLGRHPRGGDRPGLDRAGAQGRRVHCCRAARSLQHLPRPAHRPFAWVIC
jgi:acetylornithine deacetylase/succinyl-diaminopimelate desuccinylase-like protein